MTPTIRNCKPRRLGLTLLEAVIAVVLIAIMLSILLPALTSARTHTLRDKCAENQRRIGQAWHAYLNDHNQEFPTVLVQPAWMYGGMRIANDGSDTLHPDYRRPLTAYLGVFRTNDTREIVWCCPADHGIRDVRFQVGGTGSKTVFQSYGTSYRCNAALLSHRAESIGPDDQQLIAEPRGLRRDEITTAPSRLLLGGDPIWFEIAESTGREADWHGNQGFGNLLFLDGSVRYLGVRRRGIAGPIVFDPRMKGSFVPTTETQP